MDIKEKIFSGRYFMTISIIGTYCLTILAAIYFVATKVLSVEMFLGLMSSFVLVAREIADSYFKRDDRNGGKNEDTTKTIS